MSRLMARLFKGIAILVTVIGAIVLILMAVVLFMDSVYYSPLPPARRYILLFPIMNILIASAVEIASLWLLVVINIISRRYGLIATLVIVILVGIAILISNS